MDMQEKKGGNIAAIATMFALFFMIAFVTNFATPMGVIAKSQFQTSNFLSQLGNAGFDLLLGDEDLLNILVHCICFLLSVFQELISAFVRNMVL